MVQLATRQRTIVLDGLALDHSMQELLQPLLGDAQVYNVFHGDIKHMSSLDASHGIMVDGPIIDLAEKALWLDGVREDGGFRSLRTLCEVYLELELPSLPSMGSWLDRPLPEIMLQRAALDAHVLILIKDRAEWSGNERQ